MARQIASISDLPSFVIDQIIGTRDTSYVVIKLWICGDFTLHNKLSNGITFLDLKSHPLRACRVPVVISHLRNLRHLSLYSRASFNKHPWKWRRIIRSWPNSIEFLSLYSSDQWQHCLWRRHETHYTRGVSRAIELETLFPHLHTLVLGNPKTKDDPLPPCIDSSLFAALPSSLTVLDAFIMFIPPYEPLSSLPPNIRHLKGPTLWTLDKDYYAPLAQLIPYRSGDHGSDDALDPDEALDSLRNCFASAPSTLETINTYYPSYSKQFVWATDEELATHSDTCWLPQSLLDINWCGRFSPRWSPSIARTTPPNLQSLAIQHFDADLFVQTSTNWAAELPRSLTKLALGLREFNDSHTSVLPPNLTDVTISSDKTDFGDCRSISGVQNLPSHLTRLNLANFYIEPHEIIHLPQSISTLLVSISSTTEAMGDNRPRIETKLLPLRLTDLSLHWTSRVRISLSLEHLELLHCDLCYITVQGWFDFPHTKFKSFPHSLERLTLASFDIGTREDGDLDLKSQLPNLKYLTVYSIDCNWFEQIPRSVVHLRVISLRGLKSPLSARGGLCKHLPISLTSLMLEGGWTNEMVLPPQDLSHLTSLLTLKLECTSKVSSRQLRTLPRTLKRLETHISKLKDDDVLYLPPHLELCHLGDVTPALVQWLPLTCLAQITYPYSDKPPAEIRNIARSRVRQASVHQ